MLLPTVAVTVTVVSLATAFVVIVNVAPEAPCAIATDAGGTAEVELEVILTASFVAPVPAAALKETDPLTLVPPTKLVGVRVRLLTRNGVTVSVDAPVTPP